MPPDHQALTLATPPEGFAADAPANFLMPLRAGTQAVLHLTRQDGAAVAVTCRTGKMAGSNLPLGKIETLAVDCRGEAADDPQWHDLFSPRLGVVVQRQSKAGTRELIAVRPVTAGWPLAARAGLDWALSHALDDAAAKSTLQWSSTGVAPHFDIKVSARIKGGDAGLGKAFAAALLPPLRAGANRQQSKLSRHRLPEFRGRLGIAGQRRQHRPAGRPCRPAHTRFAQRGQVTTLRPAWTDKAWSAPPRRARLPLRCRPRRP